MALVSQDVSNSYHVLQVHIKKLRLDMFEMENNEDDGEDNVRRWGDDAERQQEETNNSSSTPVVDVFDELLGTPTTAAETTILPPVSSQPVTVSRPFIQYCTWLCGVVISMSIYVEYTHPD